MYDVDLNKELLNIIEIMKEREYTKEDILERIEVMIDLIEIFENPVNKEE